MLYQKFKSKINLLFILMSTSLIILIAFVGYSFLAFRDELHLSTHGKEKLQSSLYPLETTNEGTELLKLVKKNKNKEANSYIEKLQKQHKTLDQWLKTNSVKDWKELILEAQSMILDYETTNSLNAAGANSLMNSILALKNEALSHNWKRVLMFSEQMLLYAEKQKETMLKNTLNSIEELVSISSLTLAEKNLIKERCKKIDREIDKIESNLNKLKKWQKWAQDLESQKEILLMDLKLQLTGSEKRIEEAYKSFQRNALLGLILAISAMIGCYFLLQRWSEGWQLDFETDLDLFLRDEIFKGMNTLKKWVREKSQKQFKRHTDFILQKFELGAEFEMGVPLPCLILNHEYSITWANDLFLEQFSMRASDLGKEFLDWKYISQFIIIGDEDPIEKTIQEKVPGIYQIKLKLENEQIKSYELHVSPLSTITGEKVMVLFYPLSFIEESIHSQINLITQPLEEIIPKLDKNFNPEDETIQYWTEELKKSGQVKILKDILELRERIINQQHYFHNEQHLLNQLVMDYQHTVESLNQEIRGIFEEFRGSKDVSRNFGNIINEVEADLVDFKHLENKISKEMRNLLLGIETLRRQIYDLKNRISDAQTFVTHLDKMRKSPEDLKNLDSIIMKLQFTLNVYNLDSETEMVQPKEELLVLVEDLIKRFSNKKEDMLAQLEKLVEIKSQIFKHTKTIKTIYRPEENSLSLN